MLRSDLIASLEAANASIARGEGPVITRRSMQSLAKEAKQRLRRRLVAEQRIRNATTIKSAIGEVAR